MPPEDQEVEQETADLERLEAELGSDVPEPSTEEGDAGSGAEEGASAGSTGAEVPTPPATAAAGSAPAKTYRLGDRDYTEKEIIEGGLLEKVVTQANQVAHFQRLRDEEKARADALDAKLRGGEAPEDKPAPSAPAVSQAQLRTMVAPQVKQISEGAWGPQWAEFAKELPDLAADIVVMDATYQARARTLHDRLAKIEAAVSQVYGAAEKYTQEAEDEAFRSRFNTWVDAIAAKPLYDGLRKAETRTAFTAFVAEELANENTARVTPERLERLYWSFLYATAPSMFEALRAQAGVAATARARAAGEAGGRRAAAVEPSELEKLERELETA